jgi:hypothetical protein
MKKIIFAMLLVFSSVISSKAQDYKTGIGLRGGLPYGLTVKHFVAGNSAIEGILASRWEGFNFTGLYEIHSNIFIPRLNLYCGLGGHVGAYDGNNKRYNDDDSHAILGIDGILGIEYNFIGAPLGLGVDWKPAVDLIGATKFWGDELAFSIRYIF